MAGTAKPNVVGLREEANYTLIGGVGNGNSKPSGLFNGVQADEWDSANVMYWNALTRYVEIDILSNKVNIWRSGTTSWKTYNGALKIEKWNGTSYDNVTSQYTQTLTAITEKEWEKTISNLPKGRYKFSYNTSLRMDSEWYIENVIIYKTFILHNGEYKIYTLGWNNYSSTLPTVNQFISDGMGDLSVFDRKSKTETIIMNDDLNTGNGEVLGNGKIFKKTIDLNKYFDLISLNVK